MPSTPPKTRAGARDIPCVPPPEGWEAAGEAAEEGTAATETLNEEPGGPYFDASDTLPLPADELITAGAPIPKARLRISRRHFLSDSITMCCCICSLLVADWAWWQDAVTGVVSSTDEAKAAPSERAHHVSLGALTEAVAHAAERAAAALRQASEDGTRGTP